MRVSFEGTLKIRGAKFKLIVEQFYKVVTQEDIESTQL